MRREVLQIDLQIGHHFRRLFWFEMSPVFGLQTVLGRELPLRLQHELGEAALGESLHDPHAEPRRGTVEWIKRYESFKRLRSVVVAQLGEVVLAKIAVNAVFIRATSVVGEVIPNGPRPSEVAEAQADDSKGIGDAPLLVLLVRLIEVVTGRYLIVEQGSVLLQGFLVEILFVERPPELVESEFIVRGTSTMNSLSTSSGG